MQSVVKGTTSTLMVVLSVFSVAPANAAEPQYCKPIRSAVAISLDKQFDRFREHCKLGDLIALERVDWAARLCDLKKPTISIGASVICTMGSPGRTVRLPPAEPKANATAN
jgi:hypothetical protein